MKNENSFLDEITVRKKEFKVKKGADLGVNNFLNHYFQKSTKLTIDFEVGGSEALLSLNLLPLQN